jgi:hypothetical protein
MIRTSFSWDAICPLNCGGLRNHRTDSEAESPYRYHIGQLERVEASKAAGTREQMDNRTAPSQAYHVLDPENAGHGCPTNVRVSHPCAEKEDTTGEVYITAQQDGNSTQLFYGRTSIDGSFLKYVLVIFNFITKATIQYMRAGNRVQTIKGTSKLVITVPNAIISSFSFFIKECHTATTVYLSKYLMD